MWQSTFGGRGKEVYHNGQRSATNEQHGTTTTDLTQRSLRARRTGIKAGFYHDGHDPDGRFLSRYHRSGDCASWLNGRPRRGFEPQRTATDSCHAEPRSSRRTDWTADFADVADTIGDHDEGLNRKERKVPRRCLPQRHDGTTTVLPRRREGTKGRRRPRGFLPSRCVGINSATKYTKAKMCYLYM